MNDHGGVDHIRTSLGGGCSAALYYDRKVRVVEKKKEKKREKSFRVKVKLKKSKTL